MIFVNDPTALVVGVSLQFVKTTLFVGFFTLAGIAAYYNESKVVRRSFVAVLLVVLVVSGATGLYVWPFFNWHLYPGQQSQTETFYELRVVDAEGNELKYDARAVRPALATPMRRYGKKMVADFTRNERRRFGCFLLDGAESYRDAVGHRQSVPYPLKFPPHQFGYQWTPERLNGIGEIRAIRDYRITVTLSEDGRLVRNYDEEMVLEVTESRCS